MVLPKIDIKMPKLNLKIGGSKKKTHGLLGKSNVPTKFDELYKRKFIFGK